MNIEDQQKCAVRALLNLSLRFGFVLFSQAQIRGEIQELKGASLWSWDTETGLLSELIEDGMVSNSKDYLSIDKSRITDAADFCGCPI